MTGFTVPNTINTLPGSPSVNSGAVFDQNNAYLCIGSHK